ncbi:hypothetical protein BE17_15170 [Sorangium cellulosum]|uniref:Uncharacterized protein n=1 Tax=Sorangium cellulosum TaxID=56 RepID=A0A150RGB6_SORCE|nr:hypothetical protein BE17_15170 [Sorangium cellulosum]
MWSPRRGKASAICWSSQSRRGWTMRTWGTHSSARCHVSASGSSGSCSPGSGASGGRAMIDRRSSAPGATEPSQRTSSKASCWPPYRANWTGPLRQRQSGGCFFGGSQSRSKPFDERLGPVVARSGGLTIGSSWRSHAGLAGSRWREAAGLNGESNGEEKGE